VAYSLFTYGTLDGAAAPAGILESANVDASDVAWGNAYLVGYDNAAQHVFLYVVPQLDWADASEGAWNSANWNPGPIVPPPVGWGDMTIAQGIVNVNAAHNAYKLTVNGSGTVNVSAAGGLNVGITADVEAGSSLTVAGGGTLTTPILNTAGTVNFEAGSSGAVEVMNITGGSTTAAPSIAIERMNISDGLVDTSGAVTVMDIAGGTVAASGTVGTMKVSNGAVTATGTIGTLDAAGGVVSATGVTITESMFLKASEATYSVDNGVDGMQVDGTDIENPAVARTVTLKGGTVTAFQAGMDMNKIRETRYNAWPNNDDGFNNVDNGVADGQQGGIFTVTPDIDQFMTTQASGTGGFGGGDNYAMMWSGNFHAPETGTYEFRVHGDDWEVLWLDLDRDQDFEFGGPDPSVTPAPAGSEMVSDNRAWEGWNTPHNETVDLEAGRIYAFAFCGREVAGGEFHEFSYRTPGMGALAFVNPTDPAQDGLWSVGAAGPINQPNTTIAMTANSTLDVGHAPSAEFGVLDLGNANDLTIVTALDPVPLTVGTLSGDGTISGAVTSVIVTGTVAPGTGRGTVSVDADLTLADGASFDAEVLAAGTDLIECPGTITIGANASLNLLVAGGGNEFQAGNYMLTDAIGGTIGVFANVTDLKAYVSVNGNGLTYDDGDTGIVTLTLDLDLNPADANLDGQTDVSDRIVWNNNNFTYGTTFTTGDWNNDGRTDVSDRIVWNNNNFTFATGGPGPITSEAPDADDTGPKFIYDVETGIMTVDTNGHFITDIVLPAPEGVSLLPEGLSFNSRGDFALWQAQNFRGSFQAYDGASNGGDGIFDLARFPLGLTHADFGQAHWGALPVPNEPGIDGFSDVIVIPEPATMALLALGGMALALRRRRGKA